MSKLQLAITAGSQGPASHTFKSAAQVSTGTLDTDINTTVAADVATLVADGATPTQAHVTTLNTDYTTLVADWTTLKAQTSSLTADVTIIIDSGLTKNKLREILRQIEQWVCNGSTFLAKE